ncbi:MAG: hypothetical protein HC913_05680 [Microscillaceae bacterium]|nr:hypothetical protein [Microscillaceae bacterium]
MNSILLYNLYPKNHWKPLTAQLLKDVPHTHIAINVTLDFWDKIFKKNSIRLFLTSIPKVKFILFTENDTKLGETKGFEHFRKQINFNDYGIATYIHSKGVTKPNNPNINDWVEMMRYFQIDRFDLCQEVFREGYQLYGVNLGKYSGGEKYGPFKFSDFHFSGTFVSVNLNLLKDKFLNTPIDKDYFGIEGFFGKLCPYEKAFCAHDSGEIINNHYHEPYPSEIYKTQY